MGLHERRLPYPLPRVALWDVVGTVLIAGLLGWITGRSVSVWLVVLVGTGHTLHRIFGARSPMLRWL